jgi:hypothetical protein
VPFSLFKKGFCCSLVAVLLLSNFSFFEDVFGKFNFYGRNPKDDSTNSILEQLEVQF